MNNKTHFLNKKQLREKLLEGQKIPSFEPLNLEKNETPLTDGLKSLCSKGPSFVLAPPHYNCSTTLQLFHHIAIVPPHYNCSTTSQLFHHSTVVPPHYSCSTTLQLFHHVTIVSPHCTCPTTLQLSHHITVVPPHHNCSTTLQLFHHITIVPPHYNWLQLQEDFDKFRNSLRSCVFCANKEQNSNNNFRNNNDVNNPLKKKSSWSAPKTNSSELDIFLTFVARDFILQY